MKFEKRFTYVLFGTLGLAACGGGDGGSSGTNDDGNDAATTEGSGGSSASGGSSGSIGGSGSGGMSTGGTGTGTGGAVADGGSAGSGEDGGTPAEAGVTPDAAADDGGGMASDGGAAEAEAGPPPPDPAGIVGYVYAGKESSAVAYAPSASYSFNASGGSIAIEKTSTGTYAVDFSDVDTPMRNVQVTAYDHSGYCVVSNFGSTSATVRCYDNDAVLTDAKFSLLAFGPATSMARVMAYAVADKESVAQYGPNGNYSFSASGGAMVARRSGPGTYSLEFGDLDLATGNVQLTALDNSHHCSLNAWADNTVNAICYNELGQREDTRYLVMVVHKSRSGVEVLGYARSINSTDASNDLTGGVNTFNATGRSIISEHTDTGVYKVTFAGADFSTSHPEVTGLFGNKHCGINRWASNWVEVGCYDSAGAAANSLFSLVVVE